VLKFDWPCYVLTLPHPPGFAAQLLSACCLAWNRRPVRKGTFSGPAVLTTHCSTRVSAASTVVTNLHSRRDTPADSKANTRIARRGRTESTLGGSSDASEPCINMQRKIPQAQSSRSSSSASQRMNRPQMPRGNQPTAKIRADSRQGAASKEAPTPPLPARTSSGAFNGAGDRFSAADIPLMDMWSLRAPAASASAPYNSTDADLSMTVLRPHHANLASSRQKSEVLLSPGADLQQQLRTHSQQQANSPD